jgi:hypothetical protein
VKTHTLTCDKCSYQMCFLEKPGEMRCEKCEHNTFLFEVGEISSDDVIVGALKRIAYLEASICELKHPARRTAEAASDRKDSVPFVVSRGSNTSH